jgi:hypothetical protein
MDRAAVCSLRGPWAANSLDRGSLKTTGKVIATGGLDLAMITS